MLNWTVLTLPKIDRSLVRLTCAILTAITCQIPAFAQPFQSTAPETTLPESSNASGENYSLGPGDRINIAIFGAPEYSGEALVLSSGSVNLPLAGNVSVQGMNLQQAADAIAAQYAPFLRHSHVTVTLVGLRPVRVGVAGEVNRPGSYTIALQNQTEFPTVTDAIKLAGGITSSADLRRVQVYRQQMSGSEQIIEINLWEMLKTGDLNKDIILQGGDGILIPTAVAIDPAEVTQLGTASFAPDTIPVYVVGQVRAPGSINIPPNTSLNQAILAAGGFNSPRAQTSSVRLLRLNENGTASQRRVAINFNQGIDEESNPILRSNDVIVVERSGLASFSDSADLVLGPFGRILSGIFGILNIFD